MQPANAARKSQSSFGECKCTCNQQFYCVEEMMEDTATFKLKLLQRQLERGEVPDITELRKTVDLAVVALCSHLDGETVVSQEEMLECVPDQQVREWLSATFTRADSVFEAQPASKTPGSKFKAAANTIIISQYLGNIHKDLTLPPELVYSEALTRHLEHINDWGFDIFEMDRLTGGTPLRYVARELLKTHNLFEKCDISIAKFDSFLVKIEEGYGCHGNPYHNACHGADVAQTLHSMLHTTACQALLSGVEMLAVLIAAIIHDVDHPGTTNGFQINQCSDYALLYNDRSVLENHHLHFAFALLRETDCNFLSNFSTENFKLLRGLVIEMVLATDMSSHFDQLKYMRHVITLPEAQSQLQGIDRGKMLSLLLHMADISHPGKPWLLHQEWTTRLAEEFYRQGDTERLQGLPLSPLCDRKSTNIATSQLGFIEYIVSPSFELCGDLMELLLNTFPLHQPKPAPIPTAAHNSIPTPSHNSIATPSHNSIATAAHNSIATPSHNSIATAAHNSIATASHNSITTAHSSTAHGCSVWDQYLASNRLRWQQQQQSPPVMTGPPHRLSKRPGRLEKQVRVETDDHTP